MNHYVEEVIDRNYRTPTNVCKTIHDLLSYVAFFFIHTTLAVHSEDIHGSSALVSRSISPQSKQ
jgi:hypothetical protein